MTWYSKKAYTTAKKTTYNGKAYDSKFEAGHGMELEMRKKAKEIKGFDTHVRIPLEVNGYNVCDYYIDFVVYHNDDSIEYIETKGYIQPTWKIKWKLFEALYGDKENVKLTCIFQGKSWKPRGKRKL